MDKKIADLILRWHSVYVALGNCIESARVVLDQSNRGTLLPDRVREMRGELLNVQEAIPALADLLEELTGELTWPMKAEAESTLPDPSDVLTDTEMAAETVPETVPEEYATGEGDYDAKGSTPVEETTPDEEADAEEAPAPDLPAPEADATGTP